MMDYLSSMYIDNEMNLDEKKQFLEKIRSDQTFYELTFDLLSQEQRVMEQPIMPESSPSKKWWPVIWNTLIIRLKPLGFTAAGFAAAVLLVFIFFQSPVLPVQTTRFVLFEPGVDQVEIIGSFTGWQRVFMKRAGNSGYWELNLPIESGEHRFAYILDNNRQIADPTLSEREKDDFGGENSILNVEEHI